MPGEITMPAPALLGERLVARGLATAGQVALALQEQKRTGALLGEILLQLGCVSPRDLAATLAEQRGVPFVDLETVAIPAGVAALVPEAMARRLKVLPLALDGRELLLAMANVFDLEALAEVERHTRLRVSVACADEDDLLAGIARTGGDPGNLEQALEQAIRLAEDDTGLEPGLMSGLEPGLLHGEPPIVQLVDQLLLKAFRDRATDLHVQPAERTVLTRFRVDGSLVQGPSLPKALQHSLLARLKIMAEADIAETRLPQDGRFQVPHGRRQLDIRASFLPGQHGEKAVLRILDRSALALGLDRLGMPETVLDPFNALLARPHGLILVTGPTGSGKTTTLYSALASLNTSDRCIVTVEDPVEHRLPLITQVSLNPRAGLTFASGLRAILRQDPDIILVGEIRDPETAVIALRAAMTGHLVLSTLHTSDPAGAIPRLRELGLPALELAEALAGIHAQRLVRLNCRSCARPCRPEPAALAAAGDPPGGAWMRGEGCAACGGTGIRGRRAVHDLLPVSPRIRELIAAGAAPREIEAQARFLGKGSLFGQALALAREGSITLEEAVRVCGAGA